MTLKNSKAPLLSNIKLCASFRHHIQTRVTVRKWFIWVDLCDLDLRPLTLTFCMTITVVIGNNSWKFDDDTMMGTLWKMCHGQTRQRRKDGRTENTIHGAAWSQLKKRRNLFYITSFVLYFIAICWFKPELGSGNAKNGAKFTLISVTLTFALDLLHRHHFCQWWYILKISWWEEHEKDVTDGRTDRQKRS